jgi:leucyl/phenylalanyl-tRNA--protein transferase
MPVYLLADRIAFPPPEAAEESGLLAVGGDLSPERLLLAYASGIFPWYEEGVPVLWHSPDPRTVLLARELHVPRSLGKRLRRDPYAVSLDDAFEPVIRACAAVRRPGQRGTWITADMIDAYLELHRRGFAHSAEAWQDGELVGGLYGVSLGACFFGESMFALRGDASKMAFVRLVRQLERWGIDLVDCQVRTDHLARFGAVPWPRRRYLEELACRLRAPTRRGRWRFDDAPATGAGGDAPATGTGGR